MLLSVEEAVEALEGNGVPNATERVRWFNRKEISVIELLSLANLEFHVNTCKNCGVEEYHGEPEDWSKFKDVHSDDGLAGEVSGCICGESFNVTLCIKCYSKALRILAI